MFHVFSINPLTLPPSQIPYLISFRGEILSLPRPLPLVVSQLARWKTHFYHFGIAALIASNFCMTIASRLFLLSAHWERVSPDHRLAGIAISVRLFDAWTATPRQADISLCIILVSYQLELWAVLYNTAPPITAAFVATLCIAAIRRVKYLLRWHYLFDKLFISYTFWPTNRPTTLPPPLPQPPPVCDSPLPAYSSSKRASPSTRKPDKQTSTPHRRRTAAASVWFLAILFTAMGLWIISHIMTDKIVNSPTVLLKYKCKQRRDNNFVGHRAWLSGMNVVNQKPPFASTNPH